MDTPLGNGIFVFLLGMAVVFLGMLIIVISVTLCGKLISKNKTQKPSPNIVEVNKEIVNSNSEEISPQIKAAIVAVISAYYFETKSTCDFVVKKIKRI